MAQWFSIVVALPALQCGSKRNGIMNIFSMTALTIQLILICSSKYYAYRTHTEISKLNALPDAALLDALAKFQHYNEVGDYLGYAAAAIWAVAFVTIYTHRASKTKLAQLCLILPIFSQFLLSFV
ncbi:hypothetical protein ACFFUP_10385 [Vibrio ostreicida]|uniref:hypothetical protein n=1 Tax=Vibrio ostreicida TaxID=526588 RepID=UPI001482E9AC|nr:hypothetical protein [Vibrio ostreicida]